MAKFDYTRPIHRTANKQTEHWYDEPRGSAMMGCQNHWDSGAPLR
jgi:hypothetical protein